MGGGQDVRGDGGQVVGSASALYLAPGLMNEMSRIDLWRASLQMALDCLCMSV